MKLWATKSIQALRIESEDQNTGLRRALGPFHLVAIGIGGIIGAGIFVLTGQAAALYAGPAVPISMALVGIACTFAALCYAEMASCVPVAGSAYTYAYATLGELVAWIIGWDLVLEYAAGAATVGVGWSGHFVSLISHFGLTIPPALTNSPTVWCTAANVRDAVPYCGHSGLNLTGAILNLPALFVVAIATTILVIGVRESARINNIIVILKVSIILLLVAVGISYIDTSNWTPFIPANTGDFGTYGWSGIFRAAGLVFFAYIGFDVVSTAAQEAKNPQRDLPIGIIVSLLICTVLYIVVSFVLVGMVPYKELNNAAPVAYALTKVGAPYWARLAIDIGAVLGLTSVILVMMFAQSRVFFSMSRDGLLGKWASVVHPKFRTPYLSTIFTGIAVSIATATLPLQLLGQLVNIGTLFAFVLVCIGVLVLRRTRPDLPRPFRTPFVPFVPIMGILCCSGLMLTLPGDTWIRLLVWLAIGLVIYFTYGRRHSVLQKELAATPPTDSSIK
jgi:APA family basic amino acid/polyamine antiporter